MTKRHAPDPLGYDTTCPFDEVAKEMADYALSTAIRMPLIGSWKPSGRRAAKEAGWSSSKSRALERCVGSVEY
ncbi:hypothetical protein [Rhizobium leguminosarum]|uniref:hypothetical protein n=1 Tax=Rhizobium leguminosarum TaxID=384 RepID=UPI001C975E9E|nr:hypothetical protein [Rhizobium leguminosarum]MBY5714726.1 hypothetical protein [Rhizobium leguminosarum]